MKKIYYSTSVVNLLDVIKGNATNEKIVVVNSTSNELRLVCRSYTVENANHVNNANDIKKEFVINIPCHHELHWVQSDEDSIVKTFSIASRSVKNIMLENGKIIEVSQVNLNNRVCSSDNQSSREIILNKGQIYKVMQKPSTEQNKRHEASVSLQ